MQAKQYRHQRTDADVSRAVKKHGAGGDALLPILQEIQATRGHLDSNAIGATSDALGISDAHTFGLASFYSMLSTEPRNRQVIRICDGPVCCLRGAEAAHRAVELAVARRDICVERASCLGLCDRAPAALVDQDPCGPISQSNTSLVLDGRHGESPSYAKPLDGEVRIAMQRIGNIDPDDIDTAIEHGAYQSLKSAMQSEPARVIETITQSGLQGRGGAGFPTGRKWRFVAQAEGSPKYIVCNADESEPGAFKDRVLIEGDPHLLLEGMLLAGYAVGASQGTIYIRGEYEPAARRLESAIGQATERGWLGMDIQGSRFSFAIDVHRGAGAYICGEETALLESLEGRRGEPRIRPPYPTTHGLFGQPTVVNNVETLCKTPSILARGAEWYRSMGTASSPGTKLFTITGNVNRPGVFEAPFGITLREVIDQFAGGMRGETDSGSNFKMALTGGAAGTIVGPSALDVPLDFASHTQGVSLGAGAIIAMDQSVSVLTLLDWLLHFFEIESCGKCTPCREGTLTAWQLIRRIKSDGPQSGDVEQLLRLSEMLRLTSFCGLGESVAWPIESALKNFPEEFL